MLEGAREEVLLVLTNGAISFEIRCCTGFLNAVLCTLLFTVLGIGIHRCGYVLASLVSMSRRVVFLEGATSRVGDTAFVNVPMSHFLGMSVLEFTFLIKIRHLNNRQFDLKSMFLNFNKALYERTICSS